MIVKFKSTNTRREALSFFDSASFALKEENYET